MTKMVSQSEAQQMLVALKSHGISIPGDRIVLQTMMKSIRAGEQVTKVVTAFSTCAYQAGSWLGWAGILAPVFFVLRQILNIIEAYEAGQKLFVLKGLAYTTTAWAYGDPCPPKAPQLDLQRVRERRPRDVADFTAEWNKACRKMMTNLNMQKTVKGKTVQPDVYAMCLRIVSDGDPKMLALQVYDQMKGHFRTGQDRVIFQGYYSNIKYPI